MISKKMLQTLRNLEDKNYYFILLAIDSINKPRAIQKAINEYYGEEKVIVDGMIGPKTIAEMIKIDDDIFTSLLMEIVDDKEDLIHKEEIPIVIGSKEAIIQYLKNAEGDLIHWNKTESDFTTPGGVYAKLFPRSEPVRYVKELAKKYKVNLNRRNLKELAKLNNAITREEKKELWDKVYNFVIDKFTDDRVLKYLDANEALVYFSLALNGGLNRGNKAIQSALSVAVDGKIGKGTLRALNLSKDKNLIPGMLNYMQRFYDYLIRKNPKKYGLYRRGWHNRLLNLAKMTKTVWV